MRRSLSRLGGKELEQATAFVVVGCDEEAREAVVAAAGPRRRVYVLDGEPSLVARRREGESRREAVLKEALWVLREARSYV